MSLYSKLSIGFGTGFGTGIDTLFNLKPTDGTGDFNVDRADTDATEEITNGSFATDTDWTKGTGWTISGGKATTTGAIGEITQTGLGLTDGEDYYIRVTTSGGSYNEGGLKIRLGGVDNLASITEDGTFDFKVTNGSVNDEIGFYVETNNAFVGSIDDVSCKSAAFLYAATRVNENGYIEYVRPNYPRAQFESGSCPYLLCEPSVNNEFLQSEDFSTSWTVNNSTVTTNDAVSPANTTTADALIEDTSTGTHDIRQFKSGLTNGSDYVFSVFAKANGRSKLRLNTFSGYAEFDIDAGTVTSAPLVDEAIITNYGNGWYQCTIVKQANNTLTNSYVYILDDVGSLSYTGDGISGIHLWGATLYESDYQYTYIPTTTAEVTRQADEVNQAGALADFNEEGVLVVDIAALKNDSTDRKIAISDGTTNNRITLGFGAGSNLLRAQVYLNGIQEAQIDFTAGDITDFNLVAVRYKENDVTLWVNGGQEASDTNVGIANNKFNRINFDSGAGSDDFYGKCKMLLYFNEYLTDAEMQQLTLRDNYDFESGDAYVFN